MFAFICTYLNVWCVFMCLHMCVSFFVRVCVCARMGVHVCVFDFVSV